MARGARAARAARAARGRGLKAAGGIRGGFQARINLRINRGEQALNMLSQIERKQERVRARSQLGAEAARRKRLRVREAEETGRIFGRFGGRGLLNLSNDPEQLIAQAITRGVTAAQALDSFSQAFTKEGSSSVRLVGSIAPLLGATLGGPVGAIIGAVGGAIANKVDTKLRADLEDRLKILQLEFERGLEDLRLKIGRVEDILESRPDVKAGLLRETQRKLNLQRQDLLFAHQGFAGGGR